MDELTDMQIFFFLAPHLDNPCRTIINGKWHDIRNFYERLAKEQLKKMTNPYAKELLEKKIKKEI